MADLVMTLESDTEDTTRQSGKRGFQKQQVKGGDDELVIDRSFRVGQQTLNPMGGALQASNWSFVDAVKTDAHRVNEADFRSSSIEEKVQQAIKAHGIAVPAAPERPVQLEHVQQEDKQQAGEQNQAALVKEAFYDRQDLISFQELFLSKPLVKACAQLGFEHPTVIQRKTIPSILEGSDVLAHAVTGSGKTATFLLPILEKHLKLQRATSGKFAAKTRFLILQPTRELAAQCSSMLAKLSEHLQNFAFATLIGGSSLGQQRTELSKKPDVVVATTGRLLDHLQNTKGFDLEEVDLIVLDEADKLLEMGFKDEMLKILEFCKKKTRQTVMVSATLNQDIKELAEITLNKPLTFSVSEQQNTTSESKLKLKQFIVRLQQDLEGAPQDVQNQELLLQREACLLTLCHLHFQRRTIVFFNEKKQCERAQILFCFLGLRAAQVQGDMNQEERLQAIKRFQDEEVDFLLTTDLLARGLDISSVKVVLNFSYPVEPRRYVHRVGRTARAGASGVALTICNDEERKEVKKLSRKLNFGVTTFSLNKKHLNKYVDLIQSVEEAAQQIQEQVLEDKEAFKAHVEAVKAENLIRFKKEIQSRPKQEWFQSKKQKSDIKVGSKGDLKNQKDKFEADKKPEPKKRNKKQQEKVEVTKQKKEKLKPGESKFGKDREFEQAKGENKQKKKFKKKKKSA